MQIKLLIPLTFSLLLYNVAISQNEKSINRSVFPNTIEFDNQTLTLSGIGIRNKLWSDLYTQALYVSIPSNNAEVIINSDSKMSMLIHITSALITSKKFSKTVNNSIKKTVGDEKWLTFKSELDLLEKAINNDQIVKDDVFNLIYNDEDNSIWIIKNGIVRGKIPSLEFKKAFFGIWLGPNPADENLKKDLLGLK